MVPSGSSPGTCIHIHIDLCSTIKEENEKYTKYHLNVRIYTIRMPELFIYCIMYGTYIKSRSVFHRVLAENKFSIFHSPFVLALFHIRNRHSTTHAALNVMNESEQRWWSLGVRRITQAIEMRDGHRVEGGWKLGGGGVFCDAT